MKNRKNILLVFAVLLMGSCSPIYLPPAAHTPLLKEKKEYQGGLYFGTHGFDIQGAYALSDHVGFMGTGSFSLFGGQQLNSHAYGEAGLGLFSSSAISRSSLYGGVGYGFAKGKTSWNTGGQSFSGVASGRYLRPFVQTTIAFHTALFDMGINPRLAFVRMDYTDAEGEALPPRQQGLFFEPVGFMGLGFGDLKLKWQLGFSTPIATQPQFSSKGFIFSMGIYYRIKPQKLKLF